MRTLAALILALCASAATAQQYAPGPYELELDGKIYEAIGQKDWARADHLATTARQKKMVMDAKNQEAQRKAEARAERRSRVTNCTGHTTTHGTSSYTCF